MAKPEATVGRDGFVAEHGLWTDAQAEAAREVLKRVEAEGIELVRLAYPDQHGILRGKAVVADAVDQALHNGCGLTTTLLAKDTSHKTVYPVFSRGGGFGIPEMQGAGDFLMVPDPTTFRVLPWAPGTGWMLCDAYFQSGARQPFATSCATRSTGWRPTAGAMSPGSRSNSTSTSWKTPGSRPGTAPSRPRRRRCRCCPTASTT